MIMEVIYGEKLKKKDSGKMRFKKIENVKKDIELIERKGVKIVQIGEEEIVDGNMKMKMGMIWKIILRFEIKEIYVEEMNEKEGMLMW